MSAIRRLQEAASLSDVAHLLGFKPKALSYLVRRMPVELRYTSFEIPKRSGGKRLISAPNKPLKLLQSRLAKYLARCEQELEEIHKVKRHIAHGFRKNHSIMSNAHVHRQRQFVFNIDLNQFFDTINFGRVRGFFIENRNFQFKPEIATVIAQIACHNNALPQGSPCSPIISNLIGNILDMRVSKLAKSQGCSYTRYVDDLTFSTSKNAFSVELAASAPLDASKWRTAETLRKTIQSCGFSINEGKTRLQFKRSRQDVTGLVVNKKVNTPAEYRRTVRAMVHRFCTIGTFTLPVDHKNVHSSRSSEPKEGNPNQLHGMLGHIDQVDQWWRNNCLKKQDQLSTNEKLFQKFLFCLNFASTPMPVVLFEGKTDSIYLREALRSLATTYPDLAVGTGKDFRTTIRLQKQSKLMTRLFRLSSGSCPLKDFIKDYRDRYNSLSGPKGRFPVVLLLDNDSGLTPIKSLLKAFSNPLTSGAQYIHVTANLYVLLSSPFSETPTKNESHCIEHCFDEATRSVKLGEKSLSLKNDFDPSTSYGKAWFAEKVVKRRAKNIDFSGFNQILDCLAAIVRNHRIP